MSYPPVLIESWLPIEAIGAESKRARGDAKVQLDEKSSIDNAAFLD